MNKAIATAAIIGAAIISPVAAMGISPTREALLGLAPNEAILKVADEIDTNKANMTQTLSETNQKVSDLEKTVADQESVIAEQKKALDDAKASQASLQTSVSQVQSAVASLPKPKTQAELDAQDKKEEERIKKATEEADNKAAEQQKIPDRKTTTE